METCWCFVDARRQSLDGQSEVAHYYALCYLRCTTIMAYCTDICEILLFHIYTICMPRPVSNPGALECKSETLPSELCGSITLFKDVNKIIDVFNNVSFNDIKLKFISHLKQSELSNDFYKRKQKRPDDYLSNICERKSRTHQNARTKCWRLQLKQKHELRAG